MVRLLSPPTTIILVRSSHLTLDLYLFRCTPVHLYSLPLIIRPEIQNIPKSQNPRTHPHPRLLSHLFAHIVHIASNYPSSTPLFIHPSFSTWPPAFSAERLASSSGMMFSSSSSMLRKRNLPFLPLYIAPPPAVRMESLIRIAECYLLIHRRRIARGCPG